MIYVWIFYIYLWLQFDLVANPLAPEGLFRLIHSILFYEVCFFAFRNSISVHCFAGSDRQGWLSWQFCLIRYCGRVSSMLYMTVLTVSLIVLLRPSIVHVARAAIWQIVQTLLFCCLRAWLMWAERCFCSFWTMVLKISWTDCFV